MLKMAGLLIKDPVIKELVKGDLDAVKKENPDPVIKAVNDFRLNRLQPVSNQPV